MEHSGGMQASLAGRYARALFDLALDHRVLTIVELGVARFGAALDASDALRALVSSPVISRSDAGRAIAATAAELKLDALTTKFLGVLAKNRRLGEAGNIVRVFAAMAAAQRGETTAEVTSAHSLTGAQVTALTASLKTKLGRDVAVDLNVDPDILGGLVVKIGSQMIDGSIRTRLNTLATAMKG